jgi:hypothetical protein
MKNCSYLSKLTLTKKCCPDCGELNVFRSSSWFLNLDNMDVMCTACKNIFDMYFFKNRVVIRRSNWLSPTVEWITLSLNENVHFAQAINDFTIPGRRKKAKEKLSKTELEYKWIKKIANDLVD